MVKIPMVVFRCDASKSVGLGHITRCIALAKTLRNRGMAVHFVINSDELSKRPLNDAEISFTEFSKAEDDYLAWFTHFIRQHKIDVFIGDIRDDLPPALIRLLKSKEILTVAIDEPSDYRKECDLLFYPPTPAVQRLDWTDSEAIVYQGWNYVLLRDEFYQQECKSSKDQWLVMLGGTDVHRQTLPVLNHLISLGQSSDINVVVQADHPDIEKINSISKTHSRVHVKHLIDDMASFLTGISFAVINFGVSAYELAVMQVASYHFCWQDDHVTSHRLFAEMGFAKRVTVESIEKVKPFTSPSIQITKATNNIADIIASKLM
ncbi:hypothetical protein [Thalassotalea atypica]|uniref:hypothetical protein n=1 Tax=Thalassotalea atypica TaxID=2054316 RepID=UPI002573655E|nr:hypothetical protein [Thalassotalea atypica]